MYGLYIERDEAIQIVICVAAISFALAIVFARPSGMLGYPVEFAFFLAPLVVTVGSGFIMHEMAHKLLAIYYGAEARFKMWTAGLVVMLMTAAAGALFAAPGAVYISGRINRTENGLISVVGPMLNIALVFFFLGLQIMAPVSQFFTFLLPRGSDFEPFGISAGILNVWYFGASINIMLALFNMIPAFPLDGSKVYAWNRLIWLAVIICFLALGAVVISPDIIITWVISALFFTALSRLLFG